MKKFESIAYEGQAYTIEWYLTANGKSPAFDYFCSLDARRQDNALMLFKRMADAGRISDPSKFRYEGNKIYAFKPQPDRFLCFFVTGKKIIVTNAFEKKCQKLPKSEKVKALKVKNDYELRVKQNIYYNDC